MSEKIELHFKEFEEINGLLVDIGRVDLSTSYSNVFAKTFTLLCASFFESEILKLLQAFVEQYSNHCAVKDFIINKTLKRQYHTLFDWNSNSIESFLGLFGDEFRSVVKNKLQDNDEMKSAIQNFMQIGRYRNEITHKNILSYTYDKTPKDVLDMFKNALKLLDFFYEVFEVNKN